MRSVWPGLPPRTPLGDRLPPQPVPEKVKVLHVITRFIAGSGGNTLIAATGMDRERYETWVAAMPGGPLWEQAEAQGVHTVPVVHMRETISPVQDLLACVELVRLMRRERFTVVHTHCSKAGFVARVAARVAGVPVVVHSLHLLAVRPGLSTVKRVCYRLLDRSVRSLAQRYVAVAPRVAREAVEQRIAPPGGVVVIPSAVDLDEVPSFPDPQVRRDLGVPAHAPLVGTVGRIVAQKGPLDFVRMCALVHAERPEVRFVMVGDATLESAGLEAETRQLAERAGVPLLFTGFRPDAPQIAATLDVYVVPSRYEGLGRALTEALASGRPVVATAVNGVPDLVEPGVTGLLSAPGDPPGLAAGVLWMLDHPDHARAMGAAGRERVRSHFGAALMCGLLDDLYCELLGLPSRPPGGSAESDARPDGAAERLRSA